MHSDIRDDTRALYHGRSESEIVTGKTLLVASTGGHLEQLTRLVRSRKIDTDERLWVTFEHSQSATLLAHESVQYIPYIPSRGLKEAIQSLPEMFRIVREFSPDTVVSTGAAIAIPAVLAASVHGIRIVYIESVSRFLGPSLTGRLLQVVPWIARYTQHPEWANKRWRVGPQVLEDFTLTKVDCSVKNPKLFISLGTIKPFRFDRAIDALERVIPKSTNVRIQFGETERDYGHWSARKTLSVEEFQENVDWADIVIMHSGVGSILNVLDSGKRPVLLVREKNYGEHVDDHQKEVAVALGSTGLVMAPDLQSLAWQDLLDAMNFAVKRSQDLDEG